MKLTKVKIGGTEYSIKYVDKISDDRIHKYNGFNFKKTETLGLCHPRQGLWDKGQIVVKIEDDVDKTADTLFHEITHAMFAEMTMQYPKYSRKLNQLYKDEFFIQRFSEILRDVIESMKRTTNAKKKTKKTW